MSDRIRRMGARAFRCVAGLLIGVACHAPTPATLPLPALLVPNDATSPGPQDLTVAPPSAPLATVTRQIQARAISHERATVLGVDASARHVLLREYVPLDASGRARPPYGGGTRTDLRLIDTSSGTVVEHLRGPARLDRSHSLARCERLTEQRGESRLSQNDFDALGCLGGGRRADARRLRALLASLTERPRVGRALGVAASRDGETLAYAFRTGDGVRLGAVRSGSNSLVHLAREPGYLATGPLALFGEPPHLLLPVAQPHAELLVVELETGRVTAAARLTDEAYVRVLLPMRDGSALALASDLGGRRSCVVRVSRRGDVSTEACAAGGVAALRELGEDAVVFYPMDGAEAFVLATGRAPVAVMKPEGSQLLAVSPSGRWWLAAHGEASTAPAQFTLIGAQTQARIELGEGQATPESAALGERGDTVVVVFARGSSASQGPGASVAEIGGL